MKRLCTICARGGSKGVKNKNIRIIAGKPLIAHSIRAARETGLFDKISVSSDSEEILSIAKEYGVDLLIKRPLELARDTSAKLPVIQHCFLESEKQMGYNFDLLVDLDCTSPLRMPQDIVEGVRMLEKNIEASNLITGAVARRSPYFNLVQLNKYGYVELPIKLDSDVVRRQDAPKCFDMDASFYIWRREQLLKARSVIEEKTIIYEMPEDRSMDIDSELDFELVSYLLRRKNDT